MREHVPLEVEEVIDQADGPHTYLSAKFPLRDSGGQPYAVCAIATDITQRKRAEEALRESEQHFRRIVDTAHDAFVSIDATGRITAWNPQAEATFGWTEARGAGPQPRRDDHPGALPRDPQPTRSQRFMQTGKGSLLGRRVELEAVHRDGHEFPVEFTISAVRVGGTVRVQRLPARHHRAQAGRGDAAPARGRRAVLARRDRRDGAGGGDHRAGTRAPRTSTATRPRRSIGRTLDMLMPPERAAGRRPPAVAGARGAPAGGPRDRAPPQGRKHRPRVAHRVPDARRAPRDRRRLGDRARPHRAQARRGGDAGGAGGVPPRVRGRADRHGAVRRRRRPSARACCR